MFAPATAKASDRSIPATAGIGLRAPHLAEFLDSRPALDWVEVHSENYFGNGIPVTALLKVRRDYGLSLHGVGLSVGSTDPLNPAHVADLKALIERRRARLRFRASVLGLGRRRIPERSAAAALHGGSAASM